MATQENKNRLEQLKSYVKSSPYIDTKEQPVICSRFGLPYVKSVFQREYRRRFYDYLKDNIATARMVSTATGIHQQFLTHAKRYYEKKGLLKVIFKDVDPFSKRKNVQFLSTNPEKWDNIELIPNSNQMSLF